MPLQKSDAISFFFFGWTITVQFYLLFSRYPQYFHNHALTLLPISFAFFYPSILVTQFQKRATDSILFTINLTPQVNSTENTLKMDQNASTKVKKKISVQHEIYIQRDGR